MIFCRVASPVPEFPSRECDTKFISVDVPQELHAPIKNNEKWWQLAQVGKFPPYAVYEMILVKIWKQTSDATIIQDNLFHGILQKYFGKYLVWIKNRALYSRS